MLENKKIAIIGSGPAGLTAAIYAARGGLTPVLYAGYMWGGQLMTTTDVENFPGFPEGIQGPQLMEQMLKQAQRFGTEVIFRDVTLVDLSQRPFKIGDGETERTFDSVIVATGANPRKLGIPGESELWSRGVSSCATCDGAFFRDKVVAVAGGGDSAMEEATFLTRFASKVYLIHRRDEFRASKIMLERAKADPKIEILTNTVIEKVNGTDVVTSLSTMNTQNMSRKELPVDGLFLAIGHEPNSKIFTQLNMDELGYLVPVEHSMTNISGVFAAGDIHDHRYRQAITAAGAGCRAALDAEKWLAEQH